MSHATKSTFKTYSIEVWSIIEYVNNFFIELYRSHQSELYRSHQALLVTENTTYVKVHTILYR